MDIFSDATSVVDAFADRAQTFDPYMFWEPWDCKEPTPDAIFKAAEDGVDLEHDDVTALAGPYPRKFQSGHVLSKKRVSCIQAGSRTGKSHSNLVILGASISRQPPYSMRYAEGEDTGIRRAITPINVFRYGRRDARTGTLIDFDVNAKIDLAEWNCGNITGVGVFPEELYCPDGKQIWVGTLARSINTYWWRSLAGTGEQRLLPEEFMDQSRGNRGSNWGEKAIFAPRDITIFIKSYDADRKTFESQDCHILMFDEEPPKPELYVSGAGHCKYQRWSFTPWGGLTWSQSLFFGCVSKKAKDKGMELEIGSFNREEFDYFQATQYDSPYVESEHRDRNRTTFPMHERKSVIWGRYSRHEGQPFFDRSKLQVWEREFCHKYKIATFSASRAWSGMYADVYSGLPGLLEIKVRRTDVTEENMKETWRIYENPKPNVGYLATFDAAEGATDPAQVQDKSFGLILRRWMKGDPEDMEDIPIIVASTRSTLPTIPFARLAFPVLRYYNNALLGAERGHGKDNEAFGVTLDEWPFWYYYTATNDTTKNQHAKKGCDTNSKTRTLYFSKIRDWQDSFTVDQDPWIKDSWLYDEMAGAIIKSTPMKKNRCDHTKDGSLDGVICLGIGIYIIQEEPDVIVCNSTPQDEEEVSAFRLSINNKLGLSPEQQHKTVAMGAGVAGMGNR